MKTVVLLVFVTTVSLIGGCSSQSPNSESYVRAGYDFADHDLVAIVDVVGEIQSEQAKNQIADLFTLQLLRKGFGSIQRELVMQQLRESGFEKGDLSPEAYAIEAGRVLQVPAVLIIHVPTFGDETSLTAKILEVQNGSALWLGYGSGAQSEKSWAAATHNPFQEPLGNSIFQNHGMSVETGDQSKVPEKESLKAALTPAELAPFRVIARDICKAIPQCTSRRGQPREYPLSMYGN